MKHQVTLLWLLVAGLILLIYSPTSATEPPTSATVSQNIEKVVIATCIDFIPFHFNDEQNQPTGILVDLWTLWSQKAGIAVEFTSVPWADTLSLMANGQADIHAGLNFNPERDTYLDYSNGLHDSNSHVFFHKNISGLKDLEDLQGFRIGVMKGCN